MKPNVLMIICHDLGQHLGCYDNLSVETPNIDSIAHDGILFKNYFATAPLCSPSRGAIPVPGRGFVQDPVPMFEDKEDDIVGKLM